MSRFTLSLSPGEIARVQEPLLNPSAALAEPAKFTEVRKSPCVTWKEAADLLAEGINKEGLGLAYVRQPLGSCDFMALGERFGALLAETDPAVAAYVQNSVVLSLRDELRSDDSRLAPFTPGPLTLHTEGSRRPAEQQPRYIVLMCLDPGAAGDSSQTILVPIEQVVAGLTADDLAVLAQTRETVVPGTPAFVRHEGGQVRLSYRDLGTEAYELESPHDPLVVARALMNLVTACYRARPVFGTKWRRGDIVVIDNRQWMHGRTSAAPPDGGRSRHLQRLRIVSA